jgi:hypothetical protein
MRDRSHIRAHPSHKLGGLLTTILSAIWLPFAVGMRPTLLLRGRFSATLLEKRRALIHGVVYQPLVVIQAR